LARGLFWQPKNRTGFSILNNHSSTFLTLLGILDSTNYSSNPRTQRYVKGRENPKAGSSSKPQS
jgi:hypothetical protein